MEEEIYEFVSGFLKKNMDVEADIQLEANIKDLQISSYQFIQMIVELEMEYDIEIEDENLLSENYATIKDFVFYINSCIEQK